jgi:hypothetical protein
VEIDIGQRHPKKLNVQGPQADGQRITVSPTGMISGVLVNKIDNVSKSGEIYEQMHKVLMLARKKVFFIEYRFCEYL